MDRKPLTADREAAANGLTMDRLRTSSVRLLAPDLGTPSLDHFFDHFGVRMRDRACASVMVNVLKWLKKRSDYKWLGSVAKVDVEGSNPFSRSKLR